jgi:hypothetical protein
MAESSQTKYFLQRHLDYGLEHFYRRVEDRLGPQRKNEAKWQKWFMYRALACVIIWGRIMVFICILNILISLWKVQTSPGFSNILTVILAILFTIPFIALGAVSIWLLPHEK